jgi:hypothetical protein
MTPSPDTLEGSRERPSLESIFNTIFEVLTAYWISQGCPPPLAQENAAIEFTNLYRAVTLSHLYRTGLPCGETGGVSWS